MTAFTSWYTTRFVVAMAIPTAIQVKQRVIVSMNTLKVRAIDAAHLVYLP